MTHADTAEGNGHELVLRRHIKAAPETLFRAWTEPELMKQWFCPRPWTTPVIEHDLRPGGASFMLMRGPNGEELPNRGQYLEVVPGRKPVFTDAYVGDWQPAAKPFFTGVISFEPDGAGGTHYTARARHWTAADREQHERMGFHEGWGKATDQLEDLAATL